MKTNYWKWGVLTAVIIAIFLFGRSCGIQSVIKNEYSDTATTVTKDSFIYIPSPVIELPGDTVYLPGKKPKGDTLWMPLDDKPYPVYVQIDDTALIRKLNDYESKKGYDTTVKGVRIIDTVQHNKIKSRKLIVEDTSTVITNKTVVQPPKRLIGYFSLSGSRYGVGGGIGLKTPNDYLYSIEMKTDHGWHPELRIFIPIKLKKQ